MELLGLDVDPFFLPSGPDLVAAPGEVPKSSFKLRRNLSLISIVLVMVLALGMGHTWLLPVSGFISFALLIMFLFAIRSKPKLPWIKKMSTEIGMFFTLALKLGTDRLHRVSK